MLLSQFIKFIWLDCKLKLAMEHLFRSYHFYFSSENISSLMRNQVKVPINSRLKTLQQRNLLKFPDSSEKTCKIHQGLQLMLKYFSCVEVCIELLCRIFFIKLLVFVKCLISSHCQSLRVCRITY